MRTSWVWNVLIVGGLAGATVTTASQGRGGAQQPRQPPLLQDYIQFAVTPPPATLELDPFYKKTSARTASRWSRPTRFPTPRC